MLQQLYDTTSQLVETDFTIGTTDPECKVNLTVIKKPHSSGKYMEALSVLQSCDDDPSGGACEPAAYHSFACMIIA
jgi:hypothetical protein